MERITRSDALRLASDTSIEASLADFHTSMVSCASSNNDMGVQSDQQLECLAFTHRAKFVLWTVQSGDAIAFSPFLGGLMPYHEVLEGHAQPRMITIRNLDCY
jgi:hypothetical protein